MDAESRIAELEHKVALAQHLISAILNVFADDWDYTRHILTDWEYRSNFIHPDGNFLWPQVDDESNNWANRGVLLQAFREAYESIGEEEWGS